MIVAHGKYLCKRGGREHEIISWKQYRRYQKSEGVSGYIYEVEADDSQVIPFKNIPCARLATEPIEVVNSIRIENAYELFLKYIGQGKMRLGRFEDKTQQQLDWWYSALVDYLTEKDMINNPDCSYAIFIRKKLPQVWEKYMRKVSF